MPDERASMSPPERVEQELQEIKDILFDKKPIGITDVATTQRFVSNSGRDSDGKVYYSSYVEYQGLVSFELRSYLLAPVVCSDFPRDTTFICEYLRRSNDANTIIAQSFKYTEIPTQEELIAEVTESLSQARSFLVVSGALREDDPRYEEYMGRVMDVLPTVETLPEAFVVDQFPMGTMQFVRFGSAILPPVEKSDAFTRNLSRGVYVISPDEAERVADLGLRCTRVEGPVRVLYPAEKPRPEFEIEEFYGEHIPFSGKKARLIREVSWPPAGKRVSYYIEVEGVSFPVMERKLHFGSEVPGSVTNTGRIVEETFEGKLSPKNTRTQSGGYGTLDSFFGQEPSRTDGETVREYAAQNFVVTETATHFEISTFEEGGALERLKSKVKEETLDHSDPAYSSAELVGYTQCYEYAGDGQLPLFVVSYSEYDEPLSASDVESDVKPAYYALHLVNPKTGLLGFIPHKQVGKQIGSTVQEAMKSTPISPIKV
ncbi:hypothetical protein KBG31_01610 [Patescibacteria group bacterium]|nr:hypothetical protein [Patescibacteria group bacterium]